MNPKTINYLNMVLLILNLLIFKSTILYFVIIAISIYLIFDTRKNGPRM